MERMNPCPTSTQEAIMALMFPRLARNFAKNGYFPTDEPTLERILNALAPSDEPMHIIDPCGGEGVAIAEVAHSLGRDLTNAYVVEYDDERAAHARRLVDHCLHGDFNDTLISPQAFGLGWLNPPYGDLTIRPGATSSRAAHAWRKCSTNGPYRYSRMEPY
jgi:hypothetical protein